MASLWQNEDTCPKLSQSILKKASLPIIYIPRNTSKYIRVFEALITAESTIHENNPESGVVCICFLVHWIYYQP